MTEIENFRFPDNQFYVSEIKEKNPNQKKMTKIISFFLFLTEKLYICRLKIGEKVINY